MTDMNEAQLTARIHSVETFGAIDGPGIRYLLFMQGCNLRCKYCHNPDSWDMYTGRLMTLDEVITDILRYKNFIQHGGVTLSGGEPLMQPAFCEALVRRCRRHGIHTAIDTSGSVPLEVCKGAVDAADLILLDIKAFDNDTAVKLTGQGNENAFRILDYREQQKKPVWIRHVLIAGYTLDATQLTNLAVFLSKYSCVEKVELLPFHKMGEYKWKSLGQTYELLDLPEPAKDEITMAKEIFKRYGF